MLSAIFRFFSELAGSATTLKTIGTISQLTATGMDSAVLVDEIVAVAGHENPEFRTLTEEAVTAGIEADGLLEVMVSTQNSIDNMDTGINNLVAMASFTSEKQDLIVDRLDTIGDLRQLAFTMNTPNFVFFDVARTLDGASVVDEVQAEVEAAREALYSPDPVAIGIAVGGLAVDHAIDPLVRRIYRSYKRDSGEAERSPSASLGEDPNPLDVESDTPRISGEFSDAVEGERDRYSQAIPRSAVDSGAETARRSPAAAAGAAFEGATRIMSFGAGVHHFVQKQRTLSEAIQDMRTFRDVQRERVKYFGFLIDGTPEEELDNLNEFFELESTETSLDGLRSGTENLLVEYDGLAAQLLQAMTNVYLDMNQELSLVTPKLPDEEEVVSDLQQARFNHEGFAVIANDSTQLGEHRLAAGISPAQDLFVEKIISPLDTLLTFLGEEIDNLKAYNRILAAGAKLAREERDIEVEVEAQVQADVELLASFGITLTEEEIEEMRQEKRAELLSDFAARFGPTRDELINEFGLLFPNQTRFTGENAPAQVLTLLEGAFEGFQGPVDAAVEEFALNVAGDLTAKRAQLALELQAYEAEAPEATAANIAAFTAEQEQLIEADLNRYLDLFFGALHLSFNDRTVLLDRAALESAIRTQMASSATAEAA